MLILLPPSESKANRRRGRPADPSTLVLPRARPHPRPGRRARSPRSAAPPTHRPCSGSRAGLLDEVARNLVLDTAPATPAAEVYTGVLYDALGLATLDTAARRRANRWLVVVSALHGAVRPGDRITAYRLSMGSTLPGLGPLRLGLAPELWTRCCPPSPRAGSSSTAGRHVCRRVAPGCRPRRPLGAGAGAGRQPHGQAHPRPGGPAPVPGRGRRRARCRRCATWWPARSTCACTSPRTPGRRGSWTWCPRDGGGCRRPARAPAAGRRVPPRDHRGRRGRGTGGGLRRRRPLGRARRAAPRVGAVAAVRAARGRAAPIVLSLDTTAVLLTPVGLAVARQVDLDARVFAVTTLWIANTGSLLLPVSNLTNLLALNTFERQGLGHADYVRLAWAPALACVVVTLALRRPAAPAHPRAVVCRRPSGRPARRRAAALGGRGVRRPRPALRPGRTAVGRRRSSRRRCCSAWPGGAPRELLRGAAGAVADGGRLRRGVGRRRGAAPARPGRPDRLGGAGAARAAQRCSPWPAPGRSSPTSPTTCRPTWCSSRSRPTRHRG